jgi:uncharacterized RDD family membrane protein YckC
MEWLDETTIETPEQIDMSLELAGAGSRFVARAIDWLVQAAGLAVAALMALLVVLPMMAVTQGSVVTTVFLAALVIFTFVCWVGYDIYCELRHNGQTLGKRVAGLRVIREGGAPVDFRSSCIRNLLWIADYLPVFYLLGGLLVTFSSRHQRLGDMAAGTLVVRERATRVPRDVRALVEDLASPDYRFTAAHLSGCEPDDRHILRSFFQRYYGMDDRPRDRLARRLAEVYIQRTNYADDGPALRAREAEAFLASLYRDLESVARHGE